MSMHAYRRDHPSDAEMFETYESERDARYTDKFGHTHQCRECSAEFGCHAVEGRHGCEAFNGLCADCDPLFGNPWRPGDASNVVSRGAY